MAQLSENLKRSIDNTKCEYRRLGTSGLKVSVPIFGCMSFGDSESLTWSLAEKEALPVLKHAYDRGLNTWDTANCYSNGESEVVIGKALKHYAIPREKVVIMTKCFWGVAEDDAKLMSWTAHAGFGESKDYINQYGLSRQAIFNQVDASLRRLDTSYIDLLQIHRFDYDTPIEETMEALHDLVRSGKVRYIGASSMWAVNFARMQFVAEKHGWTKFVSMQNRYNLLYREEEREMNRFCRDTGVGLIPWGPLSQGALARDPSKWGDTARSAAVKSYMGENFELGGSGRGEPDASIVARVKEVADKKGWPMSHVALAWLSYRGVTSPIIGFSSPGRIDEAMAMRGKTLEESEVAYLEELYLPKAIYGHA